MNQSKNDMHDINDTNGINNIDELRNPNIGDTSGSENTKMFTQDQVNKIVEERLKKERIKTGALKDLKDAVMTLYERGYFDKYKGLLGKNPSLSDMAGILSEEIRKLGNQKSPNPEDFALSSSQAYTAPPMPQTQATAQRQAPEWSTNPKIFELFAQNKNSSMDNILNDYLKFVVQVEQAGQVASDIEVGNLGNNINNNGEQMSGINNQNMNSFDNMIRSGYNSISPAQSHRTGDNFTLTERQKELARAGGMTYREYYEFINSIPTKKLKR